LKTKHHNVTGIIDTIQIRIALDIKARGYKVVDKLHESICHLIKGSIEVHTE